ncbi:MAG: isoleucine--tRNA ligase [Desulfovibrio sp.]|jgi:isoleucyl-tRNA synthetase|nr:isoleucine--tRNA ligase [Desulfovibrio sp.]
MDDYKKTLNLPRTSFPMKANLVQQEPKLLEHWDATDACRAMTDASGAKGAYVLHDGPPYANGHIHIGTALNKILKDIIVKSRNMQGQRAIYVPGWDCHGLPIEHKVEQEIKKGHRSLSPLAVRKECRDYALHWIDVQRDEFKRLGVLGIWDDPYLSMTPDYEATTARELGKFARNGALLRAKKPVHWCCSCHTALAEAEVEYADHTSPSIHVAFPLNDERLARIFPGVDPARSFVVIWTTTPWTIPDNMAVCLHPEFTYAMVEAGGSFHLIAEERVAPCAAAFGWTGQRVLGTAKGTELEGLKAHHPFIDRPSPLVLGEHVTLDTGTGCVHTAPGHGREDYDVALKYGLEVLSPLDDAGRFLETVPDFAGMQVMESNPVVVRMLKERGRLLAEESIGHSYPHCWRCKRPVIFRATTQWFISMEVEDLRGRSLKAISDDVEWIPEWGRQRIHNMVETRPDWCISRQRQWGVPILALLCEACGQAWQSPEWMEEIADRFAAHPTGCDYWYEADLADIVPEGLKCPHCGAAKWRRETDILDVWFDSGTSFAAVLERNPLLAFPADMYLEGSDQHRGWFHSSLLASIGTRGIAPYRSVLTHGYVVDGAGRKMSKSVGNVIAPQELIKKHGAEILRLWVSSVDYREDIRISDQILGHLVDAYRRIRNTCRYLLGNLDDLTAADMVPVDRMDPLDRYALDTAVRAHERMQEAYATFEFHRVYHCLHNFCVTDLSAVYLDILKDRLYASGPSSPERRSAQTAMFHVLQLLLRDMAPVLSFTAEEVYRSVPEGLPKPVSTVFALQPLDVAGWTLDEGARRDWEGLLQVRNAVNRALEPLRQRGDIGLSLDAAVTLHLDGDRRRLLERIGTDMRSLLIVSQLYIKDIDDAPKGDAVFRDETVPGVAVSAAKAEGEKCKRCWVYSAELGTDPAHPALCPRCVKVLRDYFPES